MPILAYLRGGPLCPPPLRVLRKTSEPSPERSAIVASPVNVDINHYHSQSLLVSIMSSDTKSP